jgi:hypothetical protein
MYNLIKCEDESVIGTFPSRAKILDYLVVNGLIEKVKRSDTNRKFTKILNKNAPLKTFKDAHGVKMTIEDVSATRDISDESILVNNLKTYYGTHMDFLLSNHREDVEDMTEWLYLNTNLNKTYSKIMATNCKNTVDNIDGIVNFENVREYYDRSFEMWFGKKSLYTVKKRLGKYHFSLSTMFKNQSSKDSFIVDEKYVPDNFTGFKLYYSEDHALVEFESQTGSLPGEVTVIADVSHKKVSNTAIIMNQLDVQAVEIALLKQQLKQLKESGSNAA